MSIRWHATQAFDIQLVLMFTSNYENMPEAGSNTSISVAGRPAPSMPPMIHNLPSAVSVAE